MGNLTDRIVDQSRDEPFILAEYGRYHYGLQQTQTILTQVHYTSMI
jgi:hypothetical protein